MKLIKEDEGVTFNKPEFRIYEGYILDYPVNIKTVAEDVEVFRLQDKID